MEATTFVRNHAEATKTGFEAFQRSPIYNLRRAFALFQEVDLTMPQEPGKDNAKSWLIGTLDYSHKLMTGYPIVRVGAQILTYDNRVLVINKPDFRFTIQIITPHEDMEKVIRCLREDELHLSLVQKYTRTTHPILAHATDIHHRDVKSMDRQPIKNIPDLADVSLDDPNRVVSSITFKQKFVVGNSAKRQTHKRMGVIDPRFVHNLVYVNK